MEARVAKLESAVDHLSEAVRDIKLDIRELRAKLETEIHDLREKLETDIRDLREKVDTHFLILGGMIIATALGLAGLMAKGFHWIGG